MIPSSGTFEYEAEFTTESFGDFDIVLHGTSQSVDDETRLAGHSPKIRFWNDRLVLVAQGEINSTARNVSFRIGNAVPYAARSGDRLFLVRSGAGGIGLSLLRHEKLVLALGAISQVPLGMEMKAIRRFEDTEDWHFLEPDTSSLELQIGNEQVLLKEREVHEVGNYSIYVEHGWAFGIPGIDECVSVCPADDPKMKIASMRSAILLGTGTMTITNWDCTEHFMDQ